jgi:hypothetical protein
MRAAVQGRAGRRLSVLQSPVAAPAPSAIHLQFLTPPPPAAAAAAARQLSRREISQPKSSSDEQPFRLLEAFSLVASFKADNRL